MKKTPLRTCTACRQMKPKKELLRVVRTTEGTLCIDETGKLNGRGAYLCREANCLQRALKIRAVERALKQPLPPELVTALQEICHADAPA
ncbi:MAG: YlxR family protein [Clostridiales bacterium]|nr:YlxR family protein [Clostridiales bacterium]